MCLAGAIRGIANGGMRGGMEWRGSEAICSGVSARGKCSGAGAEAARGWTGGGGGPARRPGRHIVVDGLGEAVLQWVPIRWLLAAGQGASALCVFSVRLAPAGAAGGQGKGRFAFAAVLSSVFCRDWGCGGAAGQQGRPDEGGESGHEIRGTGQGDGGGGKGGQGRARAGQGPGYQREDGAWREGAAREEGATETWRYEGG